MHKIIKRIVIIIIIAVVVVFTTLFFNRDILEKRELESESSTELESESVTDEESTTVEINTFETNVGQVASPKEEIAKTIQPTKKTIETTTAKAVYSTVERTTVKSHGSVMNLSDREYNILCKLVYAEAGSASSHCIKSVARTILNRVESPSFPNSVEGVAYDDGAFTVMNNGAYYSAAPNSKTIRCVDEVLDGWDETNGALFFEIYSPNSWQANNLTYLYKTDGVAFYR